MYLNSRRRMFRFDIVVGKDGKKRKNLLHNLRISPPCTIEIFGETNRFRFTQKEKLSSNKKEKGFYGFEYKIVKNEAYILKNEWEKVASIGVGSMMHVNLGVNKKDNSLFVIKIIDFDPKKFTKSHREELENTHEESKVFNHSNIVRYLGYEIFESRKKLLLFYDYINGGNIFDIIQDFDVTESLIQQYMKQICNGLKYLHDNNVVHGDIKCSNILYDEDGKIVLTDFGKAIQVGKEIVNNNYKKEVKKFKSEIYEEKDEEKWSSSHYTAPEIFSNGKYTKSSDIYSLGCVCFEMFVKKPPYFTEKKKYKFDENRMNEFLKKNIKDLEIKFPKFIKVKRFTKSGNTREEKIIEKNTKRIGKSKLKGFPLPRSKKNEDKKEPLIKSTGKFTETINIPFPDDIKQFISLCCQKKPEKRPSIDEVFVLPWMKKVITDETDLVFPSHTSCLNLHGSFSSSGNSDSLCLSNTTGISGEEKSFSDNSFDADMERQINQKQKFTFEEKVSSSFDLAEKSESPKNFPSQKKGPLHVNIPTRPHSKSDQKGISSPFSVTNKSLDFDVTRFHSHAKKKHMKFTFFRKSLEDF